MSRTTNQVQSTVDYAQFKVLGGNRNVDQRHVKRLIAQIEQPDAKGKPTNITEISPITVNEKMEVIDGQHRLQAAETAGIPVAYIMRPGLTVSDALQMNITSKTWNLMDYLHLYVSQGSQTYKNFADILENHTWLTPTILLAVIVGGESSGKNRRFKLGQLADFDHETIEDRVQQIEDIARINPIFIQGKMIRAYLSALGTPGFSHERFYNNFKATGGIFRAQLFWFDNVSIIMNIHDKAIAEVK